MLVARTNALTFTSGTVEVTSAGGGGTDVAGFEPVVTQMSSSATPTTAHTGTTLQDSATLSGTSTLDGSGSITFNLYGPGDSACTTPIHTETVIDITSDGPWSTTTGYAPAVAGTYNWVASFTGDHSNGVGSTACGEEPVGGHQAQPDHVGVDNMQPVRGRYRVGAAPRLYSVANGKIKTVTPARFSYWAAFTSTGGTQTFSIDQFANETSRPFRFATGSPSTQRMLDRGRPDQSVRREGDGDVQRRHCRQRVLHRHELLDGTVVGEAKPGPSSRVRYLFRTPRLESGARPRQVADGG